MEKYRLFIKPSARKELLGLQKDVKTRAQLIIDTLSEQPRPRGYKKLFGYTNLYRIRIGSYRIIYEIEDSVKTVRILAVKHRKDVYKSIYFQ